MLPQLIARYFSDLDATLREMVDSHPKLPDDFAVMIRYAMGWVNEHGNPYNKPTGKRIRPLLLLLCTEASGGNWRQALPAAAAVELLHNFSLIHDDIEDDSPTRHGRPTVWKLWGEANAINAGDALFTISFHALQKLAQSGLQAERILEIWDVFNQTTIELTRGQHLDMRFEHQDSVSVDEYLSMIAGKSAALVSACSRIGALVTTDNQSTIQAYADFGLNLGIAFQIRDDILGIWGDPAVTGKSAATDILSRKKSLPVIYALAKSEALTEIYARETLGDADVTEALAALEAVEARTYTESYEEQYYEAALRAIHTADPQGEAADWLMQLTRTLFHRDR
ncbi:MAG: polyprenyl synthetase family protein [Anaerolineaceae bacterium]|nr:polyprenyl synthetase family protein [Anaerolineaceae bacterium]